MKIALAQVNTKQGDVVGNTLKVVNLIKESKRKQVDLVVFPELVIPGYPPKDLLLSKSFLELCQNSFKKILKASKNVAVILGNVEVDNNSLYNSAFFIENGKIVTVHRKFCLPNYDVFDEKRYFTKGNRIDLINFHGYKIAMNVCEDMWKSEGPIDDQISLGADLIINISASPFDINKIQSRIDIIRNIIKYNKVYFVYCNLVGGNEDLVFDGNSLIFNNKGDIISRSSECEEDFTIIDLGKENEILNLDLDFYNSILNVLVLGIKDYVYKNGFSKVVVGLSGGIDSSLTAALAVFAVGHQNVFGVMMPSKFSSVSSIEDAKKLANNLHIKYRVIPINNLYDLFLKTLRPVFKNSKFDTTEENIQARIRGNILMALSNKFDYLVLSTGNKSELSVGYSTLYGDMAGGYAPISDLYKMQVYRLSSEINKRNGEVVIPRSILTKEPSAELRDNQKDSDTLPPYNLLDKILFSYIEEGREEKEIVRILGNKQYIKQILIMIRKNEHKRYQAPIGIKISTKAFGQGRRMPIISNS